MTTNKSEVIQSASKLESRSTTVKHPCELVSIFLVDGNKVLFKYPLCESQESSCTNLPEPSDKAFHDLYYSDLFKDSDDAAFASQSYTPDAKEQVARLCDEDIIFLSKSLNSGEDHSARVDNLYFLSNLIRPLEPRISVPDLKIRFGGSETTTEFVSIGVILNSTFTSEWIIQSYKELLSTISAVMWFEDRRNNYTSDQIVQMHVFYDANRVLNLSANSTTVEPNSSKLNKGGCEEIWYCDLLQESSLASFLKQIFDQIAENAEVKVALNGWLQVSHCFPHRSVSCQTINCCALLDAIRNPEKYIKPYHSILMLTEDGIKGKLPLNILPNDCVNDLYRFIRALTPKQSLAQIAVEMNLTLSQVTTFAAHLLYWRRAKLIYPLNEKSILVSTIHLNHLSANINEFNVKFPNSSLVSELLDFEQYISLGDRLAVKRTRREKREYVAMIEWMLAHDILCQVHKYLFLVPDVKNEFVLEYRKLMFGINEYNRKPTVSFSGLSGSAEEDSMFYLTAAEMQIISAALSKTSAEVKHLFERLKKYANGRYNVDEIAFIENISVYDIGTLLYALPDILMTADYRDPNPLMQF